MDPFQFSCHQTNPKSVSRLVPFNSLVTKLTLKVYLGSKGILMN
jgi:hypothetical protein